jgi:hypothetical protein
LIRTWGECQVSANIIANRFNVEAFTMHKYVTITIVVDALISMDKLFNQYIFIPHDPHLFRIMGEFFYPYGLPQNCDGLLCIS